MGELTLTQSTTLPSVRATVSKHRKESSNRGARLILSHVAVTCLRMSEIALMQITNGLLCVLFSLYPQREHAFDSDVEPHRFRSLPEMSNRSANDLNNLEVML